MVMYLNDTWPYIIYYAEEKQKNIYFIDSYIIILLSQILNKEKTGVHDGMEYSTQRTHQHIFCSATH